MRKHLLGSLIFLVAFGISFSISPIRFTSFAFGSGLHGGFTAFESTDFIKVAVTREPYKTALETNKAFDDHKKEYEEIILQGKLFETIYRKTLMSESNRVLMFNRTESNDKFYCSIRKDETWIFEICSESKWHVLEFEKQYFLN